MGFFDNLGSAAGGAIKKVGGVIAGDGEDPGLLGLTPRKVNPYSIDPNAASIRGYEDRRRQFFRAAEGAQDRQGPSMTGPRLGQASLFGGAALDGSQQAQFRQQQTGLANQLEAQANGQGPSLAQDQLRRGLEQSLLSAVSAGASMRGPGAGGAIRAIQQNQAGMAQQAAGDSAALRMQEQLQAQNQLGQLLAGARGQDIGFASEGAALAQQTGLANAGAQNQFALQQGQLDQQTGQANLQATLQQRMLNDQLTRSYLEMGLSLDQAQQAARMRLEELRTQQNLAVEGMKSGAYNTSLGQRIGLLNAAGQAAAGGAAGAPGAPAAV